MSNGKALRYISYTGAPAKKFPGLFSFIFLFVLLVYSKTLPSGNRHKRETISHARWLPPSPPPLIGCRSLIPQPTEDGGRSVKVLLDGAYGFFISLRGIEWLSNHSWASVESLSHQWVTLTANGRLRFRISQNGNEPIRTVQNNSHEESNVKHLFAWKNSLTQVKGKLGHVAQVDVCCLLFSAVSVTLNLSAIVGPVGSRSWAFLFQNLVLSQFNF